MTSSASFVENVKAKSLSVLEDIYRSIKEYQKGCCYFNVDENLLIKRSLTFSKALAILFTYSLYIIYAVHKPTKTRLFYALAFIDEFDFHLSLFMINLFEVVVVVITVTNMFFQQ